MWHDGGPTSTPVRTTTLAQLDTDLARVPHIDSSQDSSHPVCAYLLGYLFSVHSKRIGNAKISTICYY